MKKALFAILILVVLLANSFTVASLENRMIVQSSGVNNRVNLRVSPNINADSRGRYYSGVEVNVLEYTNSEWAKVRIGSVSGYAEGYMMRQFLASPGHAPAYHIPTVYVTATTLSLRASRTASSRELGVYLRGTAVEILGYGESWHHVRVNGKIGFMYAGYLTEPNQSTVTPPKSPSANVTVTGAAIYFLYDDSVYSGDQSYYEKITGSSIGTVKRNIANGWGYVLHLDLQFVKTSGVKVLDNMSLQMTTPGGRVYKENIRSRSYNGSLTRSTMEPTITRLMKKSIDAGTFVGGTYVFNLYMNGNLFATKQVSFRWD